MGGGRVYEDLRERGYVGPFSFSLPLSLSLSAEWDNTVSLPDSSYLCGLLYELQESISNQDMAGL